MRARNIKPGFFSNELLGTYDPIISLMFAGLWCLADKDGRMEDRPLRIKAELFPYREGLDVNGYLTVLERDGFISRYEVGGIRYIQVENFAKHQTPHHTERPKGCPENPKKIQGQQGKQVLTPLSNGECKVSTRSDSLIPDSLIPDSKSSPSDLSPANTEDALDDDPQDAGTGTVTKINQIPYQAIANSYNETCGDVFPQVSKLTDKRRRAIRSRWMADTSNPAEHRRTNSIDYWKRYFAACAGMDFFRKAAGGEHRGDHAGWRPDFDFLMSERAWLGVREGKYS